MTLCQQWGREERASELFRAGLCIDVHITIEGGGREREDIWDGLMSQNYNALMLTIVTLVVSKQV